MSQFTGYTCDSCGDVVDQKDMTTKTVQYEGPGISGRYERHLCPACRPQPGTPEHDDLRPIRRRKKDETTERPAADAP